MTAEQAADDVLVARMRLELDDDDRAEVDRLREERGLPPVEWERQPVRPVCGGIVRAVVWVVLLGSGDDRRAVGPFGFDARDAFTATLEEPWELVRLSAPRPDAVPAVAPGGDDAAEEAAFHMIFDG